jgi:hypothetical protein
LRAHGGRRAALRERDRSARCRGHTERRIASIRLRTNLPTQPD